MNGMIQMFFLISIYLLELVAMLYSSELFSSVFEFNPWHESCGMQFWLVPIILTPVFVLVGFALGIADATKWINISGISLYMPWLAIGVINIVNVSISKPTCACGMVIMAVIFLVTLISGFKQIL